MMAPKKQMCRKREYQIDHTMEDIIPLTLDSGNNDTGLMLEFNYSWPRAQVRGFSGADNNETFQL